MQLVKVGEWAMLGGGSWSCVHCGLRRGVRVGGEGGQSEQQMGFAGKQDLIRHLNTRKCRKARGLTEQVLSPKKSLTKDQIHELNDPEFIIRNDDGTPSKYKCPVCSKTVKYSGRYAHHVSCTK